MGGEHAKAWRKIGVKVALVCDTNLHRAEKLALKIGAKAVTDYRYLLDDKSIQALSIATPDHLHFEQAKAALLAGKHVMLEKPMTTNLKDAQALVKLCQATGMQLAVGNVNRFVPQFMHAKKLAATGKLGKLFHLCGDYIHDMRNMFLWTPWRMDKRQPQDFWYAGAVHPLDLMRWVGGEIEEIFMYATKGTVPMFPLLSDFTATMKFTSGATGRLWATAGIRRRPEHEVRFSAYGDLGSIETDLSPVARVHLHPRDKKKTDWEHKQFPPTYGHPVDKELRAFRGALAAGRRPEVDVIDGARTMAALYAAMQSVKTGKPVKVVQIPR
jgi:predicted dehydrogenase